MKIYIVSGFLGAGKTTFLKKILPELPGKTALIENEFGDVGIDGDMLKDNNLPVYEIYAGCICCSLAMDFQKAICEIANKYQPDQIIIEPSGIGKLSDVVLSYERAKAEQRLDITIGRLITIVDATAFYDYKEVFGDFYLDQICNAEVLFLSHIDDFTTDQLSSLILDLQTINDKAAIFDKSWLDVKSTEICSFLDSLKLDEALHIDNSGHLPVGKHFTSYSCLEPKKLTVEGLELALQKLKQDNYGQVLRAKGIVEDPCGNKYHFNFTPENCEITLAAEDWQEKVVIIGCGLKRELLSDLFEAGK